MGLRTGDKLTIRRSATIQLTQYDSLKPMVSLTRELGEDPEADRADMERVVYVELRAAVVEELLTRKKLDKIMGDDANVTALLRHCEKVVERGYDKAQAGLGFPQRASEDANDSTERGTRRKKARE